MKSGYCNTIHLNSADSHLTCSTLFHRILDKNGTLCDCSCHFGVDPTDVVLTDRVAWDNALATWHADVTKRGSNAWVHFNYVDIYPDWKHWKSCVLSYNPYTAGMAEDFWSNWNMD